jgi:S1-C subfamily serine protease
MLKSSLITLLSLATVTVHIQGKSPTGEIGMITCSAVFISPNEVLTANHCTEDSTGKMWVKDYDGKSWSAKVLYQSKHFDLALLSVQAPPHQYVKFGKPLVRGEPVYIMSSEEDMPYTYGEGVTANLILDEGVLTVTHTASILQGASGSGLFNRKGQLVGINTAILRTLSMAVDISEVNYFLGHARLRLKE